MSHSTPEAEVVAADHGVRSEALPALDLAELVLDRKVVVNLHEDNETAALALKNGKSPAMRYLHRTHRVSISWLHDLNQSKVINTLACDTNLQKADVFTKGFTEPNQWKTKLVEIGVWEPGKPSSVFKATPKVRPKKLDASEKGADPKEIKTNADKKSSKAMPSQVENKTALPARVESPKRTIIEFCCGPNSKIGQSRK